MRLFRPLAAAVALGVLTGCAGVNVHTDYDTRADFKAIRTYDWMAGKRAKNRQAEGLDEIMAKRVAFHVDTVLTAKGLRQEKEADPDVLVAFIPTFRDRKIRQTTGGGMGFRVGPFTFAGASSQGEAKVVREGAIILEVTNFKTGEMIWRGMAEDALTGAEDAKEADEKVGRAVRALLEQFPPRR